MKHWSWIAASSTGTSHLKHGLPLQDAQVCTIVPISSDSSASKAEWFVAVACDGAGSASHGRQGAVITCRTLREAARRHLKAIATSAPSFGTTARTDRALPGKADSTSTETAPHSLQTTLSTTCALPSAETVRAWVDEARQRIRLAAEARGLAPRDFACTLVLALSNGQHTLVAHIGDGGIVARMASDQTWQALSWPDHGEYASTTRFVTDEPPSALRTHITHQPIDVLALFSDGIERMVLDMAAKAPFARFFSAMAAPLLTPAAATSAPPSSRLPMATDQPANHSAEQRKTRTDREPPCFGRQHGLSAQLKAYLDSETVNSRTDDDKTLVLAVLKP